MTASPFSPRKVFALLFITAVLALSGCVYLRLLELKKQLANFDENFKIQTTDGFTIQCLHPVLIDDDLRWLSAEPKTITPTVTGEDWHIRWVKEPPAGVQETTIYDVDAQARFTAGKLTEVSIPDRFFQYFPKELFLSLLRSAGSAKVDRTERKTDSQIQTPPATSLPRLETITGMLGQPTLQRSDDLTIKYLYRYRAQTARRAAKPIEVTFGFDTSSGQIRSLTGKFPHGTLHFDFPKATPAEEPGPTTTTSG